MLRLTLCVVLLVGAFAAEPVSGPQFTASGELQRPNDYREWIYLSSGLGMTYDPGAQANVAMAMPPAFDNVFVTPASYRAFLKTGTWPDKTMFVLDVRAASTKGSINQGGHFQADFQGMEVEVKDEARFPGKWAFFGFGKGQGPAKQLPTSASCYSCHAQHAAVDNTFVQFYPTLIETAKRMGTFKQ